MCFDHMNDLQIFCAINLRRGGDQTFVYFADLHCKLFVLGQCFLNIQIDFKAIYPTRNEHLNGLAKEDMYLMTQFQGRGLRFEE